MARHDNPLQWSDWDWLAFSAGIMSIAMAALYLIVTL